MRGRGEDAGEGNVGKGRARKLKYNVESSSSRAAKKCAALSGKRCNVVIYFFSEREDLTSFCFILPTVRKKAPRPHEGRRVRPGEYKPNA